MAASTVVPDMAGKVRMPGVDAAVERFAKVAGIDVEMLAALSVRLSGRSPNPSW